MFFRKCGVGCDDAMFSVGFLNCISARRCGDVRSTKDGHERHKLAIVVVDASYCVEVASCGWCIL
eukprot:5207879-Amphidinium_carterae.1